MAANTKKPPTKSEIYAKIVDDTGLTRKDVAAVFESLNGQIKKNLGGRGAPGMFTVPGLLKMRVVKKPARKARKGVNPFTGEEMMQGCKPVHGRRDDVQSKTGDEGCQGFGSEGSQRHGVIGNSMKQRKSRALPGFFSLPPLAFFGNKFHHRLPELR
jgi:nucleoid DNA-binding protein